MKVTNNVEKLLKILIVVIGLFCTIFVFGLITRSNRSSNNLSDSSDAFSSMTKEVSEAIEGYSQKLSRLTSQITVQLLKERIQMFITEIEQLERDVEVSNLTPMELYVNYAYEISDNYYPDIHPEYVCAIIYHESRFDPTVTNKSTGVCGLAQISPKWHTKRANKLGVTDLYDPYGNILVCFDILNELSLSNGFSYALDFYAGGYPYANRYRNSRSPFELELGQIMDEQNFAQYVLPYSVI